jgi:cellulose synthase/poly-beta-1,6-N-acetylglucosamine synthase-like glycosyltransferase
MIAAALALAGVAALLGVWSYLLYPPWIQRLAARQPGRSDEPAPLASVEVLIAAADEEAVIGPRIENLIAQDASVPLTVRVGCDGCTDATAGRARSAGGERVEVVEFPRRRGKAAIVNDLVSASRADILVFTDANTFFEPGAVRRLLEPFSDPRVGAVCGRLVLESDSAVAGAESAFWDRETRLKEAEGRLGVCLGANGAIYAARRALVAPLASDTSMDDFLIPARIARGGWRIAFAAGAVARESAGADVAAEMTRRFRIGVGAGQVLRREPWLFDVRRRPLLAAVFFSRKAARWLAPVLGLAALAAGLFDARLRLPAGAAAIGLIALALLARSRPRLSGAAGTLYYFLVINCSLAAGVLAGLAGYRRPVWRRSR